MPDIVLAVPTDLAMPIAILLLVFVLGWAIVKMRRLPHELANGFANGLTRFAKVGKGDENYAEHYAQLSACLFEAWENKDPAALLPLVANPIAIKAWNNLAPAIRQFTGRGGQKETDETETYA